MKTRRSHWTRRGDGRRTGVKPGSPAVPAVRRRRTAGAALACALLALAVAPPISSAALVHPFISAFGPAGSESSKFEENAALAIDQGSHDVYVVDPGLGTSGVLYRFHADGTPDDFTAGLGAGTNKLPGKAFSFASTQRRQVAVAPPGSLGGTAGEIYVVSSKTDIGPVTGIDVFSPEGAHLGTIDGSGNPNRTPETLGNPVAATADPAGDVYIGYAGPNGTGHVDKYVPSGSPVSNLDFDSEVTGLSSLDQIAASSEFLYASRTAAKVPLSLFPGGEGSEDVAGKSEILAPGVEEESAPVVSVGVDPASGDVYFGRFLYQTTTKKVVQLDQAGNVLSEIELPAQAMGIGIDGTSGNVYVSANDEGGSKKTDQVRIYGPGEELTPPTASIDPVTSFNFQSAHFSGTVSSGGTGEGEDTTYRFVCTPECPGLQGERSIPTDGQPHAVSDDTTGLEPETTYEVTLIAKNTGGEVKSTASFETPAKPVAAAPEVTIDLVTAFTATTAHLTGTVDPNGTGINQATSYRFEYSKDGVIWTPGEDQGPIEGETPQPVSEDLEGLEPNTTYTVRLRAENVGGVVFSQGPNPSFTTQSAAPLVEVTSANHVVANASQLNGRVNPLNAQTTFYFQWGTGDCAANPCASVPISQDADAGSANQFEWVAQQIGGLAPSTTYHYRLVAENAGGKTTSADTIFTTAAAEEPCPNESLRPGSAARLPDCRAYEMVSSVDKNGGDIATMPLRTRVSADGNAVSYKSTASFAGSLGAPYAGTEYLSSRSAGGWETHSITPYQKAPVNVAQFTYAATGSQYIGQAAPDLDTAVYRALAPIAGATTDNVAAVPNLYLATGLRSGMPHFQLLSDAVAPIASSDLMHIQFVDASGDFSKVAFESSDDLAQGAGGAGPKLYEWEDGQLRLAGILPDSACGSPPCPAPESVGGAGALTDSVYGNGTYTQAANAVSSDGSKVFFTAGSLKDGPGPTLLGSLYARLDGSSTVQIDASELAEPDSQNQGGSQFLAATANGETVFFSSPERLVEGDTDGTTSTFRYDFTAPVGHRLTLFPLAAEYVIGATGEYTYLASYREIYVLHGNELRLVASLPGDIGLLGGSGITIPGRLARMSPDGRHLVFQSRANLTGYDPHGVSCPSNQGSACLEIYLYSYDSNELVCISCNQSGAPPTGEAHFTGNLDMGLPGSEDQNMNAPLTDDGRYVFFTSPDPLVQTDSNGKDDVYAYDTEKEEVRLISSGQCNCDSNFLTASPDGHDVFFTTRQQLVRADTDNLSDLYDARIDGGIAFQQALPPMQCEGDSCQAPVNPPTAETPSSAAFVGPGDVSSRQRKRGCARGKRRVAGHGRSRCVAKQKKRKGHRRANSNRGGAR